MNTANWDMEEIIKNWLENNTSTDIDEYNGKERITIRSGAPNILKYWKPSPIKNSSDEIWKKVSSISISRERKEDHNDQKELASELCKILKKAGDYEYK